MPAELLALWPWCLLVLVVRPLGAAQGRLAVIAGAVVELAGLSAARMRPASPTGLLLPVPTGIGLGFLFLIWSSILLWALLAAPSRSGWLRPILVGGAAATLITMLPFGFGVALTLLLVSALLRPWAVAERQSPHPWRGPMLAGLLWSAAAALQAAPDARGAAPRLTAAALLAVLGLMVLCAAVFPFRRRIGASHQASQEFVATWLVAPAVAVNLLHWLSQMPLGQVTPALNLALSVGLINLFLAALLVSKGPAWSSFAFAIDWSLILIGVGLDSRLGGLAALLTMAQMCLLVPPLLSSEEAGHLHGSAGRLLAMAAHGAPPTVGFVARTVLLEATAGRAMWLAALLLVGLISGLPATLRASRDGGRLEPGTGPSWSAGALVVAALASGLPWLT